jgi:hypothetical protein
MLWEAPSVARVASLPDRPMADPSPAAPGRFGQVFDLAVERDRRTPPPEALDAIAAAARTLEALDAAGLQVRFDLTNGVEAQLRDADGALVRPVSLREVIDPSSLLPPDSAA